METLNLSSLTREKLDQFRVGKATLPSVIESAVTDFKKHLNITDAVKTQSHVLQSDGVVIVVHDRCLFHFILVEGGHVYYLGSRPDPDCIFV